MMVVVVMMMMMTVVAMVSAVTTAVVVIVFEDGNAANFDFDAFYDGTLEFDSFGVIHFVGTKFGDEKTENNHADDYLIE